MIKNELLDIYKIRAKLMNLDLKNLSFENMMILYHNPVLLKEYEYCINSLKIHINDTVNDGNGEFEIEEEDKQSDKYQKKISIEERNIITSLDVEKNKALLENITMQPPWRVGLIINQASKYNKDGTKKNKRDCKCLTIIILTNWNIETIERNFNRPDKVPCPILKLYCGLLPLVSIVEGFNSFELAKKFFIYWKYKTRGGFSRYHCESVVIKEFQDTFSVSDLKALQTNIPVFDHIKKIGNL